MTAAAVCSLDQRQAGGGDLRPQRARITNPATGEIIAEVGFASVEDVDRAVAAAKAAFAEWRSTPLSRRAEVMFRLRELIAQNRRRLAEIISLENGKTIADALGEVARGLENVEFACGIPNLLKGGYTEQASRGVDVYQIRQPLGVVAGITPFNFPAMVPLWMLSNAIACGNTFVLKPSEKVPSASVFLARVGQGGGRSRRRFQPGAGRQGCRRPAAGASGRQGDQLCRLDARGQAHL